MAIYELIDVSQTNAVLGTTGARGDTLEGLLIIPQSTSPGAVTLTDGANSIPVFLGGAGSVSGLIPFFVPLPTRSINGPWKVTTGANVKVVAIGRFT